MMRQPELSIRTNASCCSSGDHVGAYSAPEPRVASDGGSVGGVLDKNVRASVVAARDVGEFAGRGERRVDLVSRVAGERREGDR
jgi:hypothetical protein